MARHDRTLIPAGDWRAIRAAARADARLAKVRYDTLRQDFIAAASHELKTPLAGIELTTESLLLACEDKDIETATMFAEQLRTQTESMRRLVDDLLDLARIEDNPQADAVCDLRQAVDTALTVHRRLIERAGLELEVMIDGADVAGGSDAVGDDLEQPLIVHASPTDVAIILDNLLDNALRYTEAGRISLRVSHNEDADNLDLIVSDTGIGIDADELEQVFERFYRGDSSRARQTGGSGLGLALVRDAAQRWGGTVSVKSELGHGSTFTASLPIA